MKANCAHISMVLDRSGFLRWPSMTGECTVTLVQFDDVIETVFDAMPVRLAPPLDATRYFPRNSTALYDAIGQTIEATGKFLSAKPEAERPEKVFFVIITDGMENASHQFNQQRIFEMIKHQREKYRWEFVFIGANQDAMAVGHAMNISAANSINYTANSVGTQSLYNAVTDNMVKMRSGASANMAWSDDQRAAQDKAGS